MFWASWRRWVATDIHLDQNYGLRYTSSSDIELHGFADSYWAGSAADKRSTSGMCFNLGSAMISWGSRKHKSIALSTAEAEYIAACEACTKVVWLRKLICGLFDQVQDLTIIYCDNQSCIRLSEHPMFHEQSKHIEIKYYFIRDKVQEGEVKLQYISIDEQTTYILTKPLSRIKFSYLRDKMGLVEITPLAEGKIWIPRLGGSTDIYTINLWTVIFHLENDPGWVVPF
jgi:hypothetical protein